MSFIDIIIIIALFVCIMKKMIQISEYVNFPALDKKNKQSNKNGDELQCFEICIADLKALKT